MTFYKARKTKKVANRGDTHAHHCPATLNGAVRFQRHVVCRSPHCVLEELIQHVVKMCGDVWDGGLQVSCAGHLRSHTVGLSGHLSLHTTVAIMMLCLHLYLKSLHDSL